MSRVAPVRIRDATDADAVPCADIYRPYVCESVISFETDPPTAQEMGNRIGDAQQTHAWVVAEVAGQVVGYAYGHPFASRAAYRWSCETSIYIDAAHHGVGIGRALYEALLDRLAERGYRNAFAGMTLPNEASARLHLVTGFEQAGTYRRVGWKSNAWHDVAWFQRSLGSLDGTPPEPR
jgi:L-amino acid N-acyltransferase YncA